MATRPGDLKNRRVKLVHPDGRPRKVRQRSDDGSTKRDADGAVLYTDEVQTACLIGDFGEWCCTATCPQYYSPGHGYGEYCHAIGEDRKCLPGFPCPLNVNQYQSLRELEKHEESKRK